MKLSIPAVGQRIRFVRGDDNGLGGMAVNPDSTGHVSGIERLDNGGFSIEITLDQPNYLDNGTPPPRDSTAWLWGWDDRNDGELHPNGFDMPALMAFHYYCEYADNTYNEHNPQTDEFEPTE